MTFLLLSSSPELKEGSILHNKGRGKMSGRRRGGTEGEWEGRRTERKVRWKGGEGIWIGDHNICILDPPPPTHS